MKKSFFDIFEDNIVLYRDLGDEDTGGTLLSDVISTLKCEKTPPFSVVNDPVMIPLIIGNDQKLHPVFKEDCNLADPFCYNYEYNPKRLPMSFFRNCALDIFIVDQTNQFFVCHLCYRAEELEAEYWEVFDDFLLPKANITPFIHLAQRIQNASLSELLA